jgi:DNA repair exonuclease SbcCD ATPase subunit
MRLISLRLRHFRRFDEAAFRFGPGLTVISGANDTGKSTLIEGIVWALCGAGSVRRSEESLRRLDAPSAQPTSCLLEFAAVGDVHSIERTLDASARAHDAVLRRADGAAVASGAAAGEALAALLGAGRDGVLHACLTGRRELQQLAQLRPAERLRMLARLLGRAAPPAAGATGGTMDAVRALEQELADAAQRMRALESAPGLHAQYTAELEQLRADLAAAEALAETLHSEWSQKRQDVDTKLETYMRRSDELRLQIDRLAGAGGAGVCPTCGQSLGAHVEELVARLDEEFFAAAQDMKWLVQRKAQLERKPPDLAEAVTRRARMRAAVADRAERAARCEQAMQELWTVAGEKKRAADRLERIRGDLARSGYPAAGVPLGPADLREIAAVASGYVARITDGGYDRVSVEDDGRVYAYRGGTAAPVVGGGDEDLIALALRLAIMREAARHTPELDLLLLDEPFGSLDRGRTLRAGALLRELTDERPQIVVATRGEALHGCADAVIEL